MVYFTKMCSNLIVTIIFVFFFYCLVDANVDDELAGCIQFVEEFQNRYGDMRPEFFLGTLDQAIKIACFKPAKDVRI